MYREAIARYPRQRRPDRAARRDRAQRLRSRRARRAAWEKREKGLTLAAGMLRALMNATDWNRPDLRNALVEMELDLGRFDRAREACGRDPVSAADPALCGIVDVAQGRSNIGAQCGDRGAPRLLLSGDRAHRAGDPALARPTARGLDRTRSAESCGGRDVEGRRPARTPRPRPA